MVIQCILKKSITAGKYLGKARKAGAVGIKEKYKGAVLQQAAT